MGIQAIILQSSFTDTIWVAIVLFLFVWIYAWAKGNLGSAKLAILFAAIIIYLTVYQHPELVWIGVILFLFATFGKELSEKLPFYKP